MIKFQIDNQILQLFLSDINLLAIFNNLMVHSTQ